MSVGLRIAEATSAAEVKATIEKQTMAVAIVVRMNTPRALGRLLVSVVETRDGFLGRKSARTRGSGTPGGNIFAASAAGDADLIVGLAHHERESLPQELHESS